MEWKLNNDPFKYKKYRQIKIRKKNNLNYLIIINKLKNIYPLKRVWQVIKQSLSTQLGK